jgi:DNA invertase Pin-like site-specific DNA recombinase
VPRVLIYARYSTDEQHPSSITDQVAYCREFLARAGVGQVEPEVLSDAELSGELVSRPGIDQVRAGIVARRWDLVIVEDSSRLFRHQTACGELIEEAVDRGIRVLCLNDDVDTAEENWEDPLHDATQHHARSNRYAAKRIKRKQEGLWRMNAAIGLLRPGYKRRPSTPATRNEPEEGPFFDEIDPQWSPVVVEAYERVARKEPVWRVAQWLTERGLPKTRNAKDQAWTEKNVIALIKRTIYRGWDVYRTTVARKQFRTGKHLQVRNDAAQVLTRDMPHLRIVPDGLWYAAQEAIQERTLRDAGPTGAEHPLAGIPRDSRGPLSGTLVCGVCGGKMYREGRVEGGYRCSGARQGGCWNKATALLQLVHARIGQAIVEQLLALDGSLNAFLGHVQKLFRDDEPLRRRNGELQAKQARLHLSCKLLLDAIEKAEEPSALLAARLRDRERELAVVSSDLERLKAQHVDPATLPAKEQIVEKIHELAGRLLEMDRDTGDLLRRLASPIRAVPHQVFDGNLVVLRAKFNLRLPALLPEQFRSLLDGAHAGPLTDGMHVIPLSVDLFEPSAGPRHFVRALALSEAGRTLVEIAAELGIAKRQAHIAVQFGRKLREAGVTDPYRELTRPPAAASRWRTRPEAKTTE